MGGQNPQRPIPPPLRQDKPSQDASNATTNASGQKNSLPSGPAAIKRKAEDLSSEQRPKIIKTGSSAATTPSPRSTSTSLGPKSSRPSLKTGTPAAQTSYRGTGKQVPLTKPASNGTQVAKPVDDVPKKEPKKGSYAEIMARAKATQSQPVGQISHKPKGEMPISFKKEMKLKKKEMRDKKLGIKKNGNQSSSAASTGPNSPRLPQSVLDGKSKVLTAKAKPKPKPPPAYRGTMNPANADKAGDSKNAPRPQKPRRNEYAGTDEDLDDGEDFDEEDDRGDFGDESSDDMEAGFDDVEDEEHYASKEARREDVREAALEAELKREKEAKKRKLEQLAKKAKPQRY